MPFAEKTRVPKNGLGGTVVGGEKSGPNRRRFKRRSLEILAGVKRGGQFGFEYCVQVSEGGMLLGVCHSYDVGETVEISFFIPPDGKEILLKGKVIYQYKSDQGRNFVGICFISPSAISKDAIRIYVGAAGTA
jgi:PilZ domain